MTAARDLDREKAISFAAIAAKKWCSRTEGEVGGSAVLQALMTAASWVTRARAYHGLCPVSVHELVDFFETPLCECLPEGPNLVLVEKGEVTPLCEEMAADAGVDPSMEVEHWVILRAMENIGFGSGSASRRCLPRVTARCWIPSTSAQVMRKIRATPDKLVSISQSITRASNIAVNLDFPSAQGTGTCLTPC